MRQKCTRILHLPVSWLCLRLRYVSSMQFSSETGIAPVKKKTNCEKIEAKVYTDHTLTRELVLCFSAPVRGLLAERFHGAAFGIFEKDILRQFGARIPYIFRKKGIAFVRAVS